MSDRVKAHRKRMKSAGWKQSAIWLPPQAESRLVELSDFWNLPRQEVITRLILQAGDQLTAAAGQPPELAKKLSKKKLAKKKPVTLKKKGSKKKQRVGKTEPSVELDAVGLERPIGYGDWEAAVSIRIDRGVNNALGKHTDWDFGMIRHSYMWDSEVELQSFKKKHKKALSIETTYPHDHKHSIVYHARYPDGVKDHRIVLGALPLPKIKKRN